MKKLVPILLIAIVGFAIWKRSPGIRSQAQELYDSYGGWTEEARRGDPVGFIEFAEKKLGEDIESFRASKRALASARQNAQAKLEEVTTKIAAADELAAKFKLSYQGAEATAAYPVAVLNQEYSREQLIGQVQKVLNDKATFESVVPTYVKTIDVAAAKGEELDRRVADIESKLVQLEAQKELARIQKLTADADELLAQVSELLGENSRALDVLGDDPIRGIEGLMAAAAVAGDEAAAKARTVANPQVLDFLNDSLND